MIYGEGYSDLELTADNSDPECFPLPGSIVSDNIFPGSITRHILRSDHGPYTGAVSFKFNHSGVQFERYRTCAVPSDDMYSRCVQCNTLVCRINGELHG